MDLLFKYLLHLLVLFASLISLLFLFLKLKQSNSKPNLPPGNLGWPFIGETLDLLSKGKKGSPDKFITDRMSKHSRQVFKTSLLSHKVVVFCGSSGNKFLFSNENKYVTSWWPPAFSKVLSNNETLEGSLNEGYLLVRSLFSEFLKPEYLQRYVPVMDSIAKDLFTSHWLPYKQVKVHPLSQMLTFAVACRIFMSVDDPETVESLRKLFLAVSSGMFSMPVNFPGTAFNRAIKAGKSLRQQLSEIFKHGKKEQPVGSTDLLTRMLNLAEEKGIDDKEKKVAGSILALLNASHHTTSNSITTIVNYLAEYPHVYREVLKEQMEISNSKAPGELLNWEDVKKMNYSWCVACESMRLISPGRGAFREAITDFTYAGYKIPKGWKAYWSPFSTAKNPEYFPDPERFDPSRFEGKGPAPYTFVPFGGGPRMCPGKEYARLEILVFMHNLVARFKLQKANPDEKIIYNPLPTPVNGLLVQLQTHAK